jgi:hypothetical protein
VRAADEVESAGRLAERVGTPVGGFGARKVPALLEQHAEVRRRAGVAALISARVCLHRGLQVGAILQQHSEIERTGAIAALVGASIGRLCLGELAEVLEQNAEIQRARRLSTFVCEPVHLFDVEHVLHLPSIGGRDDRPLGGGDSEPPASPLDGRRRR